MFNFFQKKLSHSDYQKIFLEISSKVFDDLFLENRFKKIKISKELSQSKIIYKKGKKFIEIMSVNELDPIGESYFEIYLGEKFNFETDEFEGYCISLNRYSSIANKKKKESFYPFPYGKIQCLKALTKTKKEFIKYAEFYLIQDDDLFDRVLKMKGIRN
ncbi:hypothetical protein [uncultured Polaribacter sp.]|uniref:hypothetical protein n=1 Tax=uncultured Polaribacter sp. TaxID=174711 RepID=UPI00259B7073|nr:hypothetical protein [uncultured Polaribacter sp.]